MSESALHTTIERLHWIADNCVIGSSKQSDFHFRQALEDAISMLSETGSTIPEDVQEWIWHMDLHMTEHDERHAGLALRAAWPSVRKHFLGQGMPENVAIRTTMPSAGASTTTRELVREARVRMLKAWEKSGEGALGPLSKLISDIDHWLQGTSAPSATAQRSYYDIVQQIVRRVAELPDRESPPDQPEMLLVTTEELTNILREMLNLPASDRSA